jgi:hypothetical protein
VSIIILKIDKFYDIGKKVAQMVISTIAQFKNRVGSC